MPKSYVIRTTLPDKTADMLEKAKSMGFSKSAIVAHSLAAHLPQIVRIGMMPSTKRRNG